MFKSRKNSRLTALLMMPVITTGMLSLTGCGDEAVEYTYEVTENYEETKTDDTVEAISDETEFYVEEDETPSDEDPIEKVLSRPVTYSTENVYPDITQINYGTIPVTIENYCDASAIEYAKEHNCEEHLLWLADYVVNCIEPQAVAMLLQIPVFQEAAANGEISKYISVYLTYNDVNQFGAMEETCYLGRDGHGIEEWDSPIYYLGHKVHVNLLSFPEDKKDDPDRIQFLQSAMIHEMMHAFLTDYTMNLHLGTGRDGARVVERDDNGKMIMDEEDRPNQIDMIPTWLQEGLAEAVEDPYGTRCNELQELYSSTGDIDEILQALSTPENLYEALNPDFVEGGRVNLASLKEESNTYNTGWVASVFLCTLAGEKLGYEAFDENGYFNSECAFYGLNELITMIHEGHSLDYVIADISFDYDKGKSAYTDTADFEEKCFGSVDDPGLIFMQKLLFDLEARTSLDPENYMPTGSVLPGYENAMKNSMDDSYHYPAMVYEVDNIDESNPYGEYYSISTIPMSRVALGGGRRTSYDPVLDQLTPEEEAERDYGYLGNEKKYIDISLEDD